jgi:hypothetical protein
MIKRIWIWYLQKKNKKLIKTIRTSWDPKVISDAQEQNFINVRNIEILKQG